MINVSTHFTFINFIGFHIDSMVLYTEFPSIQRSSSGVNEPNSTAIESKAISLYDISSILFISSVNLDNVIYLRCMRQC